MTTTKTADKDKRTTIYIGVALLLGLGYLITSKSGTGTPEITPSNANDATNPLTPAAATVNETKVLGVGSTGIEVEQLQALLGVKVDGVFGSSETLPALMATKGVSTVTLSQFANLPTINRNPLANGSLVMVKNRLGAKVYEAEQKADGSYFSTGKVLKTFTYGQAIGVIRAPSSDGNAYSVFFNDFWYGDFWTGKVIGFVNAVDIEKYK